MQETQETRIWSLGGEDALELEVKTHSSILAWKMLWTEELGGLQSTGLQRVNMTEWLSVQTPFKNLVSLFQTKQKSMCREGN